MTAPQPTPDSRAELVALIYDYNTADIANRDDAQAAADAILARWLVLDPDDDELVERISEVAEQWVDSIAFLSVDDEPTQRNSQLGDFARDILRALRGSR